MIFKTRIYDITEIFKDSESKLINNNIQNGYRSYAIKLDKLKGLIGFEIMPNRRIGTDLADIAKKFDLKGILHSDELPNYGISNKEVEYVKKTLNCNEDDAYIILLSKDYETAKKVFYLIIDRINQLIKDVPKDTRQANEDGTTAFLRPQPGSERMYPETDHPYIFIDKRIEDKGDYEIIEYSIRYGDIKDKYEIYKIKKMDKDLYFKLLKENKDILNSIDPEFIKNILREIGFNQNQIENIIWNEYIYDIIILSKDLDPSTIYYLFFQMVGDAENLYKEKIEDFDLNFIYDIKNYIKEKIITKNAVPIIYYKYIKDKKDIREIIEKEDLYKRDINKLREEIFEYIKTLNTQDKKIIYSKVFNKFKYIADSKDIKEVLDNIK
ncbi:glutamyl-tRNA(Gln) amidotransferase subunit E [Nanobdella aerobiophila]|uniref:Glutamyl-tRNA(Gln) amidotransferase subunit E n=1 Tax=Nanobdella aerobiophila TaxID=2586965 RepID=A0A915WSU7_9ARCH|nr:hypothetical protein [Nanobdella aerobiophila]BBL45670.1 glutamyl-tRNA(Gln) amidotransferase subunit E [Nanobdella aerobiophila]